MLDDINLTRSRDPENALGVAADEAAQAAYDFEVVSGDHDGRPISSVVVAGMGGSALAALIVKSWLKTDFKVPFEVVRDYDLPAHVGKSTLVIASSYSGNTAETLSALEQAKARGAQVGILASGGQLIDSAKAEGIAHIVLPAGKQPRMAVTYNLKALLVLLVNFGLVNQARVDELSDASEWLASESVRWTADKPTASNLAKQLAEQAVGKTPVFYGGPLTASIAYKWKIGWNENAKNVAFCNEFPEMNHNEFMGWTSHPVEKPFAVFDLVSSFERPEIKQRFEVSDRMLSGRRPKATVVNLVGDSLLKQLLWGSVLADFASIYVAILNQVDPTPVDLIEKLKKELA